MLQYHPLRAERAAFRPERLPVEHAGADLGPAILFGVLAWGREVLHMGAHQRRAVTLQQGRRVRAAAGDPGNIGLPWEAPSGAFEQQVQRGLAAVHRRELPAVVVVAEADALRGKAGAERREL